MNFRSNAAKLYRRRNNSSRQNQQKRAETVRQHKAEAKHDEKRKAEELAFQRKIAQQYTKNVMDKK